MYANTNCNKIIINLRHRLTYQIFYRIVLMREYKNIMKLYKMSTLKHCAIDFMYILVLNRL